MFATVTKTMTIRLGKSAVQRIEEFTRKRLCLSCGQPLGDDEPIRGIHRKCYHATRRAIRRGDFTDLDRVREGKLLEVKPAGRPASNPVTIESRS